MGFWEDLGAATEEFGEKFTTARKFRIQRQETAARQALERRRVDLLETDLFDREAERKRQAAIREQIRPLVERYNSILRSPTASIWDFKNRTITENARQELLAISREIAALDLKTGEDYADFVSTIYNPPKPADGLSVKAKEAQELQTSLGRPLTESEKLDLYGIKPKDKEADDTDDKMIRNLITDFLKDDKALMLAKAQAESEGRSFDPAGYAAQKASQALQAVKQGRATLQSLREGEQARAVGSSGIGDLRKLDVVAPAPQVPTPAQPAVPAMAPTPTEKPPAEPEFSSFKEWENWAKSTRLDRTDPKRYLNQRRNAKLRWPKENNANP